VHFKRIFYFLLEKKLFLGMLEKILFLRYVRNYSRWGGDSPLTIYQKYRQVYQSWKTPSEKRGKNSLYSCWRYWKFFRKYSPRNSAKSSKKYARIFSRGAYTEKWWYWQDIWSDAIANCKKRSGDCGFEYGTGKNAGSRQELYFSRGISQISVSFGVWEKSLDERTSECPGKNTGTNRNLERRKNDEYSFTGDLYTPFYNTRVTFFCKTIKNIGKFDIFQKTYIMSS